jgi:hypothetical protein
MTKFNILVPVETNYSYDIEADTLEQALEMIASGEADSNSLNLGDENLDGATAYEVTANGLKLIEKEPSTELTT